MLLKLTFINLCCKLEGEKESRQYFDTCYNWWWFNYTTSFSCAVMFSQYIAFYTATGCTVNFIIIILLFYNKIGFWFQNNVLCLHTDYNKNNLFFLKHTLKEKAVGSLWFCALSTMVYSPSKFHHDFCQQQLTQWKPAAQSIKLHELQMISFLDVD